MRAPLLLVGLLLVSSAIASAQSQAAISAHERSDAERMRGVRVPMSDETLKPGGRDLDLGKVQKKNMEINELVRSVNLDLQNLQKGVRAADLPKKLKQLEKLAKELRQSLEGRPAIARDSRSRRVSPASLPCPEGIP
jgi:hypothetical protein